jgi:hypothetical protein
LSGAWPPTVLFLIAFSSDSQNRAAFPTDLKKLWHLYGLWLWLALATKQRVSHDHRLGRLPGANENGQDEGQF